MTRTGVLRKFKYLQKLQADHNDQLYASDDQLLPTPKDSRLVQQLVNRL